MPLTINRPAKVYRLWLEADRDDCFTDHADKGWICTYVVAKVDGEVTRAVRMQLDGSKLPVLSATLDDVVVSDGVTVEVQDLDGYNSAAGHANRISRRV